MTLGKKASKFLVLEGVVRQSYTLVMVKQSYMWVMVKQSKTPVTTLGKKVS